MRAAWEASSSNLELGNRLSIYLKTEENQENLFLDGRSQDLPGAYWLLASSQAAKEYGNTLGSPNWVPYALLLAEARLNNI
jgi:hypothetical protein